MNRQALAFGAALATFATAWELFSRDVRDVLDEGER